MGAGFELGFHGRDIPSVNQTSPKITPPDLRERKGEESVSGAAEEPEGLRLRLGPATFCPPRQVNDTDKPEDALRP